jgi:hypothetical protein
MAQSDPAGGRLVAGRYRIVGELGRGGIGVVWRAEDLVIGRQVALKELRVPPGLSTAEHAVFTERVLREARTAGRLSDPSIVTVYDVVPADGSMFIVMELVTATTLAQLLDRNGPLPAAQVAQIALRVLSALDTAHQAGIVHRDVKPSNIMLLPDGRVKLADFGIAQAMDDPSLTGTGGVMGSPGYMAPELFHGSAPTAAGDLWSLGATLFHLVEGQSPFQRDTTAATIHAIMYSQPTLERCTGPLADVVTGLLAQSPEDRLTAAGAREVLAGTRTTVVSQDDRPTVVLAPVSDKTAMVGLHDRTAVVDPDARRRTTRPVDEPGPAPLPWGGDEWAEPRKGNRRRILLVSGAAVLVLALVGVAVALTNGHRTASASGVDQHDVAQRIGAPGPTTGTSGATTTPKAEPTVTTVPLTTVAGLGAAPPAAGHPTARGPAGPLPTTVPPPTVAKSVPTVSISRYHNPVGNHITVTSSSQVPAGFTDEGSLGYLVRTNLSGTVRFYLCQMTGAKDYFSSVDQSGRCEGQTTVRMLGYIFTGPPPGVASAALYRCNSGGSHYDSLRSDCEGAGQEEGRSGYVL